MNDFKKTSICVEVELIQKTCNFAGSLFSIKLEMRSSSAIIVARSVLNVFNKSSRHAKNNVHRARGKCRLAIFDTAEILPHQSSGTGYTNKQTTKIGDVTGTFRALKNLGIKIAICTSEDREETKQTLSRLGVEEMIDTVRCAKDPAILPKPHPSNVDSICASTGIRPADIVVIGNTQSDIKLGQNAKVGLTIGICPGDDCDLDADETVHSIDEIIPLLGDKDIFYYKIMAEL